MKLPRLIKQHLFGNNKTREKEAEENHSKKEEDGIEERTVESIFQKIETELVFPYSSEPETYTFWTRRGELYDYELGAGPRKLLTSKFDAGHEVHQLRIAFPAEILARINFDHVAKQNYVRVIETELVFPYSSEPETYTYWTGPEELPGYELGDGPQKLWNIDFQAEPETRTYRISFPADQKIQINFDHVAKQNYVRVIETRTYQAEIKIDHSKNHGDPDRITVTKEPFLKNQENPSTHQ
jgi:hypothetical protein